MSALLATVVDFGSLAKTALASLVAGSVVTLSFSLAILGAAKASELREEGRGAAAMLSVGLGLAALIVSIAAVGVGLIVMIND